MKKLEDIPKKNIFETPEGYFGQLPSRVQARISSGKTGMQRSWALLAVRYALPVFLAVVVFTAWQLNTRSVHSAGYEEILASVDTNALVAYLEDNGITTDDLLQPLNVTQDDVIEIEDEVYDISFEEADLDELLDEYAFELDIIEE